MQLKKNRGVRTSFYAIGVGKDEIISRYCDI